MDDDAMTSPVEVDSFEPRSIGSSEQQYQNHDETGVVTRQDRFEADTGGKILSGGHLKYSRMTGPSPKV